MAVKRTVGKITGADVIRRKHDNAHDNPAAILMKLKIKTYYRIFLY